MTSKRALTIQKLEALAESTTHAPEAEAARAKVEELKIHKQTVQISPITKRDPLGRVTFAFYIMDGDRMIMTDGEGAVVRRRNGELYEQTLEPGQDRQPHVARFAKEIRDVATGGVAPGFYGPIRYSNKGIV